MRHPLALILFGVNMLFAFLAVRLATEDNGKSGEDALDGILPAFVLILGWALFDVASIIYWFIKG